MASDVHVPGEMLRPRDLALLLLASGDLRPRRRARDQQADQAGLELKRRVLDRVAALDPDPENFEATLMRIVQEIGSPSGPMRAVAISFHEDWRTAQVAPDWVDQLLHEALRESSARKQDGRHLHG